MMAGDSFASFQDTDISQSAAAALIGNIRPDYTDVTESNLRSSVRFNTSTNSAFLTATLSQSSIREDSRGEVTLVLTRSSSDLRQDLRVRVIGGNQTRLPVQSVLVIPAGQNKLTVRLVPRNDNLPQAPETVGLTFTAPGFRATSASIEIIDDEQPFFQNPNRAADVNNDGEVSVRDALFVINAMAKNGGAISLQPPRDGISPNNYLDVNGDYQVTALDALSAINQLIG